MLESPEMLCALSLPVTEAIDGGLKCLVALMVKCSLLAVLGCCHQQLHRKSEAVAVVEV